MLEYGKHLGVPHQLMFGLLYGGIEKRGGPSGGGQSIVVYTCNISTWEAEAGALI